MGNQQRYIHNVASSVFGQVGLTLDHFKEQDEPLAQFIYDMCAVQVRQTIEGWSAETLGKVAACGVGDGAGRTPNNDLSTLYEVHCGTWLNKYGSGRGLLLEIATTAIVAAMTDNVRAHFRREQWQSGAPEGSRGGMPIPNASRYGSWSENRSEHGSRSVRSGRGWRSERGHRSVTHSVTGSSHQ